MTNDEVKARTRGATVVKWQEAPSPCSLADKP